MGGAEDLRLLLLELQRIDGDDVAGARHRGPLHGVHPDPAAPDDDDRLAGLDVSGVHRRAPPGGDAAADEGCLVERDVVVDLDATRSGRDRVLAERADAAHDAEVLAAGVVPGREVGDLTTGQQVGAEVAQVLVAGGALRALATRRDEAEHDVVAGRQARHARADLEHLTGALVAADHRELLDPELLLRLLGERQVASEQVLVGVTQPRPDELHQHLTGLGRIELDLLDAPLGLRFPQDRGLHLHGR